MTICDFCDASYFARKWRARERRPHHTSASDWYDSIAQPCTICSLLLSHVKTTVRQAVDCGYRGWLDTHIESDILQSFSDYLPLYELELRTLPAKEQSMLICRPKAPASKDDLVAEGAWPWKYLTQLDEIEKLTLPQQSFLVFPLESGVNRPGPKGNTTDSSDTFNQIDVWFKECNSEKHTFCRTLRQAKNKPYVPTRLVDVGTADSTGVKLIHTQGNERFTRYTTLSHCWGPPETMKFKLTTETLSRAVEGLRIDEISRSFQEAIVVTRRLGARYIWIDSLCIIQKGDDDDWKREAKMMADVYGSSYCNIAAVNAQNSTEGLFRRRRVRALPPSTAHTRWDGERVRSKVIRDDFWSGELLAEPLYSRAWVVQGETEMTAWDLSRLLTAVSERLLSPRTLNFGKSQVFWQCLTTTACESMPAGISALASGINREEIQWRRLLARSTIPNELTTNDLIELQNVWRTAVESYTSCNLTKDKDKLLAIAGIAIKVLRATGERYIAGLWQLPHNRAELVEQLAWRVRDCQQANGQASKRHDVYRAPSWAWPSLHGMIVTPPRVKHQRDYILPILEDPQLELEDPTNVVGLLKSASLRVQSRIYQLDFEPTNAETLQWRWHLPIPQEQEPWCLLYPDEPMSGSVVRAANGDRRLDAVEARMAPHDTKHILQCLVLLLAYTRTAPYQSRPESYSGHGLAVKAASGGKYSRIGLVEFRWLSPARWKLLQKTQIIPATSSQSGALEQADSITLI